MKFLARESLYAANGDLRKIGIARVDFYPHRKKIYPKFPAPIKKLSKIDLHDSLIRKVTLNKKKKELQLVLHCGENRIGYFDLVLVYSGVDLKNLNFRALKSRCKDPKTEVLYGEIDKRGRKYSHSIIFYPKGEINIVFSSLTLQKVIKSGREYKEIAQIENKYSET